jgi:hypothetical protein
MPGVVLSRDCCDPATLNDGGVRINTISSIRAGP